MEQIKVGDYIRGFMPKDCMFKIEEKYIGLIAEVIHVDMEDEDIKVKFSDNYTWYYPIDQAVEHLCTQDMIDFEKGLDANAKDCLEETPFHKPDFSHLKGNEEKVHLESLGTPNLNFFSDATLGKPQQETLFSVYLSLGKVRIIYIDQTEEDVRTHQKNNPNWHIIVVKQEQDKGIQIVIKE